MPVPEQPEATKSTLLILGAGGRLGQLLRRYWRAHPPKAVNLWFQSRQPLGGPGALHWSPGDAPGALPACDAVVALWGRTAGTPTELALNTTLADHSRAVALTCGATRLLHLSSAAVYGAARNASEATPPDPANPYGQSKYAMEQRVAGYADADLHHCCLRLANVVGADSLAPALDGAGPVTLDRFADGRGPLRSYIGPGDLADILVALARLPAGALPPLLNLAAPDPIAMQDLAEAAEKAIIWRDAPASAVQEVTMESRRLQRLLPDLSPTSSPARLIATGLALRKGA